MQIRLITQNIDVLSVSSRICRSNTIRLARGERSEHAGAMVTEHLKTGGKRLRVAPVPPATSAFNGDADSASIGLVQSYSTMQR